MKSIIEIMKELPNGYEEACFTEKAIIRKRGISNPSDLMLLSLLHLVNGCTLIEISEIARISKLGTFSDVAFMKRFENCGSWFKWILAHIDITEIRNYEKPEWLNNYEVLALDASDVSEKGRSGRIYRLHYALNLFNMQSASYRITEQKTGESLCNFVFNENDLIVGDRIYSTFKGINHCLSSKANFVLRLRKNSFNAYDVFNEKLDILEKLKVLEDNEVLDLPIYVRLAEGKDYTQLRICAVRKHERYLEQTKKKIRRKESRKQINISDETKEFNNYIVVVTALPNEISGKDILDLYRLRWQVEIYFKRLKSIMDFGELPKRRPASAESWLNGKLIIALLIEKLMNKQFFFPNEEESEPQHLARE